MRNLIWFLSLLGVSVLGFFVLVPILGVLLVFIAAAAVFLFAAPWLARLPWFRDRISVHRQGAGRTVRFGRGVYMSYQDPSNGETAYPHERPRVEHLDSGDVIDVEGRELPDEKE